MTSTEAGDTGGTGDAGEAGAAREGRAGPESLLDTLRIGIVMLDGRGDVLLWSPMTEEILGWTTDEIAGRPIQEFIEDGGGTDERVRTALREEHHWRGILHIRHREGHLVEVEGRATLLEDTERHPFVLANIVETSRLRAVEHDLAALDALFAYSPLGIALFDSDRRFVRINEALARLHGSSPEALVGKTVRDVLPASMSEEISRVQSVVLETGRSVVDLVLPSPDGEGARSVSFGRLTDRGGQVLGVSCTVMDITERLEALNKVETARERLALLDDVGVALGDLLDVRAISQALASALVPRFADYSGVLLLGQVLRGGDLPGHGPLPGTPLHQVGIAARYEGEAVERMFALSHTTTYEPGSFFGMALDSGTPHLATSQSEIVSSIRPSDPRARTAVDLDMRSMLAVPLRARGIVLGLLVVSRSGGRAPLDPDDLALAMELADRAGTSLDNARLYAREREGALMLQRSLLPQHLTEPPGVRVASRYVPGSSGNEAGGDWFDVIPLPGGRVAFVVGDVMGHGLHSAVTMGRLRTAVRTLAGLDLPPAELLDRVSDLGDDLAQGFEDPLMATCVYAVYEPAPSCGGDDSASGTLTVARAGHMPPLLVTREPGGTCRARTIDLPSGAPLGVGGVGFASAEIDIPEDSVLVLYTDGLVENRDEDISEGIDRLCARLSHDASGGFGSLEEECDALVDNPVTEHAGTADDVALLMAELGPLPRDTAVAWSFSTERYAVRRAREAVRATLRDWRLDALEDTAVLLVSELVTNALRYAHGPIGVRMVREGTLTVEVSDPLRDPPRERVVTEEHEGGRGIQLVAREARRWGTRHGHAGKTVWFELPLP
ncbi:SpoIIE family protein phosphatase [Streptomyces albiaxialis]|uniref:SpoIIE family protein phosphatase n=1 Tax=Streptomyces albiaxialis TaxID=329523 RepID=UPI0031D9B33F